MNKPQPRDRRTEIEAWWYLASRILAFFLGCVLGTILVVTKSEIVWAYMLAIALCGPTVAISVERMLLAMRGRSDG